MAHKLMFLALVCILPSCGFAAGLFDMGKKDKTRVALQDKQAGYKDSDAYMQAINDAATGTVKQTAPGSERPPNTCNEMMARAVVMANEERALAYDERDDAVNMAQKALQELGEANVKLSSAQKKVLSIQTEIEELKESTSILVDKTKLEAQRLVNNIRNETNFEMEKLQNSTTAQIEKYQQEKNDAINAAETKAATEIADYKQKRDQEVADILNKTDFEMEMLRNSTEAQIALYLKEKQDGIEAAALKAAKEIADYKAQRDQEVADIRTETKRQIDNSTQFVLEQQKMAQIQIANIKQEAKELVDAANAHAKAVELAANNTIIAVRKEAEDAIHAANLNATKHVEMANKLADEKLQEAKEAIHAANVNATKHVEMANKLADEKLQEAKDEIARLMEAVENIASERYGYAGRLSVALAELAFFKNLHSTQPYCNMTLIKQESARTLEEFSAVVSQLAKKTLDTTTVTASQNFDRATLLVKQTSQPHIEKLSKVAHPHLQKLREAYAKSPSKKIVDETLYPFYKNKVVPACHSTERLLKRGWNEASILQHQLWKWTIKCVHDLASWELKMIEKNSQLQAWTPSLILQFLHYVQENTEEWIILKILISLLITVFVLWKRIFQLIIAVILLPSQIAWFFCPLRILLAKPNTKIVKPEQSKEKALVSRNCGDKIPSNTKTVKPEQSKEKALVSRNCADKMPSKEKNNGHPDHDITQ